MAHIAGGYSATYNAVAIGQIDDGFEWDYSQKVQDIDSDLWRAREDGVYQGVEMNISFVLNEPTLTGVQALLWPWTITNGDAGVTGVLMSTLAFPLILTKCTGNAAVPTSLTFTRAVLWTEAVKTKLAGEQRKVAVSLAILPVPKSSAAVMGCAGGVFYTFT
jgi:hypothetical protein